MDLVGWVTLDNRSGKQFDHARIKLMAGDVNKVQPQTQMVYAQAGLVSVDSGAPQVTEKACKTIEYDVTLQPNEERTVTYTARYSW
jgi:hypothetical protein